LKKRSKKLLLIGGVGAAIAKSHREQKIFGSFFQKRTACFLTSGIQPAHRLIPAGPHDTLACMSALSLHAPVGDLTIFAEDEEIVALEWGWGSVQEPSPMLLRAKAALDAYFDGAAWPDNLPLRPAGSPYRQKVWAALRQIPPGETRSYAEIAQAAGGSARSVGGANAANPIPILIPCHRVVGSGGLGGYSGGDGLATKRVLLELEKMHSGSIPR
jgi:methylated-DNA-[protein]-cysteine S-methyltransferase